MVRAGRRLVAWGAAAGLVLYRHLGLLPGFAALGGVVATAIGIAPRGIIAWIVWVVGCLRDNRVYFSLMNPKRMRN